MKFNDIDEKLSSLKVGETAYFILPTDFIPLTNYHNLPMVEQELCSFEQVMYTSEPVVLIKALEDEGFIVALASIKGSWLSRSIELLSEQAVWLFNEDDYYGLYHLLFSEDFIEYLSEAYHFDVEYNFEFLDYTSFEELTIENCLQLVSFIQTIRNRPDFKRIFNLGEDMFLCPVSSDELTTYEIEPSLKLPPIYAPSLTPTH